MKKFLASVVVVILLLSVICCVACTFDSELEQVVKCANTVKNMMDRPETFEVAGDCGYRQGFQDDIFNVYIVIQFKAIDNSGEEFYEIAYFVNGSFVGFDSNYDDKSYEKWSESRQLKFLQSVLIYVDDNEGYDEVFEKEKINKELGIGVSSGEIASGIESVEA